MGLVNLVMVKFPYNCGWSRFADVWMCRPCEQRCGQCKVSRGSNVSVMGAGEMSDAAEVMSAIYDGTHIVLCSRRM